MSGRLSIICLSSLSVAIASCSSTEPVPQERIFPATPGNYWIYQTVIRTLDGELIETTPFIDSVWVEKDTIIGTNHFSKIQSTNGGVSYWRDSANCVLMNEMIIYSTNPDTLYAPDPNFRTIMTHINSETVTPAGTFTTSTCQGLIRKTPENEPLQFAFPSFDERFYSTGGYVCSEEVGIVKEIYHYVGIRVEKELVRYRIN